MQQHGSSRPALNTLKQQYVSSKTIPSDHRGGGENSGDEKLWKKCSTTHSGGKRSPIYVCWDTAGTFSVDVTSIFHSKHIQFRTGICQVALWCFLTDKLQGNLKREKKCSKKVTRKCKIPPFFHILQTLTLCSSVLWWPFLTIHNELLCILIKCHFRKPVVVKC